jgi:hypothetical protein
LVSLVTSVASAYSQIHVAAVLTTIGALAVLAGKFALTGVIIPIVKGIPTLVFGIWFKDWWEKRKKQKRQK